MIATTSLDGTLRLWSRDGKILSELSKYPSSGSYVSFSRDGRHLATSTSAYEDVGQVWDLKAKRPAGPLLRHTGSVRSIRFDSDGRRVVTASDDGTAQVWDPFTGTRIGRPLQHMSGVMDAEFSPDGLLVVTASSDGTARVWSSDSG